jgi:hypothetical protein
MTSIDRLSATDDSDLENGKQNATLSRPYASWKYSPVPPEDDIFDIFDFNWAWRGP